MLRDCDDTAGWVCKDGGLKFLISVTRYRVRDIDTLLTVDYTGGDMATLQYKTVLEGALPFQQFLKVPTIYMAMPPLPLKGVRNDFNARTDDIVGTKFGGIKLRSVKSFPTTGKENTKASGSRHRSRVVTKPASKSNKTSRKSARGQKRVNGRFSK